MRGKITFFGNEELHGKEAGQLNAFVQGSWWYCAQNPGKHCDNFEKKEGRLFGFYYKNKSQMRRLEFKYKNRVKNGDWIYIHQLKKKDYQPSENDVITIKPCPDLWEKICQTKSEAEKKKLIEKHLKDTLGFGEFQSHQQDQKKEVNQAPAANLLHHTNSEVQTKTAGSQNEPERSKKLESLSRLGAWRYFAIKEDVYGNLYKDAGRLFGFYQVGRDQAKGLESKLKEFIEKGDWIYIRQVGRDGEILSEKDVVTITPCLVLWEKICQAKPAAEKRNLIEEYLMSTPGSGKSHSQDQNQRNEESKQFNKLEGTGKLGSWCSNDSADGKRKVFGFYSYHNRQVKTVEHRYLVINKDEKWTYIRRIRQDNRFMPNEKKDVVKIEPNNALWAKVSRTMTDEGRRSVIEDYVRNKPGCT